MIKGRLPCGGKNHGQSWWLVLTCQTQTDVTLHTVQPTLISRVSKRNIVSHSSAYQSTTYPLASVLEALGSMDHSCKLWIFTAGDCVSCHVWNPNPTGSYLKFHNSYKPKAQSFLSLAKSFHLNFDLLFSASVVECDSLTRMATQCIRKWHSGALTKRLFVTSWEWEPFHDRSITCF